MAEMTSRERVLRTLERKPVDHSPVFESIWGDTVRKWTEEGHLEEGEDLVEHFGWDMRQGGWLNSVADLDFEEVVLEETEETKLVLNGNGATLRWHKQHASTPEHVDFKVKERGAWEGLVKPHLLSVDRRRLPFEAYGEARRKAAEEGRFMFWGGVAPFEQMHPVAGHEYMLMGMALDPDWVKDMVTTYAEFTIMHLEELFGEEGEPDGMYFFEDLGFKQRPFMSPAMYEELVEPGHRRLFEWSHARGLKVMVHSCGFVEPLVEGLVRAGMDCLQAMEVKAGMDMPRLAEKFAGRLSFCGGIDARVLISNDRDRIEAEMQAKIPPVLERGCGYIVHSDHSIPPDVEHDTLVWFQDRARELTRR
jgi:uroporphyrinogen decarboxylase